MIGKIGASFCHIVNGTIGDKMVKESFRSLLPSSHRLQVGDGFLLEGGSVGRKVGILDVVTL